MIIAVTDAKVTKSKQDSAVASHSIAVNFFVV